MTSAPRTARARARAELTREILDVARRQLAEQGAAALSLRAVARELGMVSSALYRYFPGRDELLTALIVEAYDAVGEAAEKAEARVRRADLGGRWLATARATRRWAVAQPQEWALLYGSPVPGFAAPADTLVPGERIPALLIGIIRDAHASGRPLPGGDLPLPGPVRSDLAAFADTWAPGVPADYLAAGMLAWTTLVGSVSMELFGQLYGTVNRYEAYFSYQMGVVGERLGFTNGS